MLDYSIEHILKLAKLEEYLVNFETNGISDILKIDDDTLQNIGIEKIGHRKRILEMIKKNDDKSDEILPENENGHLINIDDGDEPPPLPPKQPKKRQPSIKPQPPVRNISVKKVPVKPPRLNVKNTTGQNYSPLHVDSDNRFINSATSPPPPPSTTQLPESIPPPQRASPSPEPSPLENMVSIPPIPPRSDLGENLDVISNNSSEVSSNAVTDNENPGRPHRPARRSVRSGQVVKVVTPVDIVEDLLIPGKSTERQEEVNNDIPEEISDISTEGNDLSRQSSHLSFHENFSLSPRDEGQWNNLPRYRTSSINMYNNDDEPDATNSDTNVTNTRVGNLHSLNRMSIIQPSEDELSGDDIINIPDSDDYDAGDPNLLSLTRNKEQFLTLLNKNSDQLIPLSTIQDINDQTPAQKRQSRYFSTGKEGYLEKRGGQRGDKTTKKRWVSFDNSELKYSKDKGSIPLQTIPLCRMTEVEIDPTARKPTFHLKTPNRRFTFMEPNGNLDEIILWANILTEAIMVKDMNGFTEGSAIGGKMANPNKEGWLNKEGHGKIPNKKLRYVALKDDVLCYYYNFEDFKDDLPINRLQMNLVHLKDDPDKLRLSLFTNAQRTYVFEADDEAKFLSWKAAIEESIQYALGDVKFLYEVQENDSNMFCADCNAKNPIYASVNLMVIVCSQCIGCHRALGVSISKTKSLLMDVKVWTPPLIKLLKTIGNKKANSLWSCKLPEDEKISPSSEREVRELFVAEKYKDKRYFQWSEMFGQPDELGEALRSTVKTENVLETLKLLVSGVDVYYVPENSEDQKTPYELAVEAGMELQAELLRQYNGHLTAEEREKEAQAQKEFKQLSPLPETITPTHDKNGILLMKTLKNDQWKDRLFTLQGRNLYYRMASTGTPRPDDSDCIDLTKLEELEFQQGIISLKFSKCTYALKAFLPEEASAWYNALRNKQVMGVPIELQDCNNESVPYLIAKCIEFVEKHGLTTEGIYRKSGGQGTIKRLIFLFNQNAPNVRMDFDTFSDVHAVSGLLKQYLRNLPEPIVTSGLYAAFTKNSYETDHYKKLNRYKQLLESIPTVNYAALRSLIVHLHIVAQLSEINLMSKENLMLLFGPIFLNKAESIEQSDLRYECAVALDLLEYHAWLFDVLPAEEKQIEAMVKATKTMHQLPSVNKTSMNSLQITVYVEETEDQMKMDDNTMPSDVCIFCLEKHKLSVDGNWALFEVRKDPNSGRRIMERPVYSKEPVMQLALTLGSGGMLVVKPNYVAEKLAPYYRRGAGTGHSKSDTQCLDTLQKPNGNTSETINGLKQRFMQQTKLGVMGMLHYARNDKWKRNYYVEVKGGLLKVFSRKGATREEESIAIQDVLLYLNLDEYESKKKQPPGKHCFTLKLKDGETRSFSSDSEKEFDGYVAVILNIKTFRLPWTRSCQLNDSVSMEYLGWGRFPERNIEKQNSIPYQNGIWTPINSNNPPASPDRERTLSFVDENPQAGSTPSTFWGRQSTYIRARESSHKFLNQLQSKRNNLKHHLFSR